MPPSGSVRELRPVNDRALLVVGNPTIDLNIVFGRTAGLRLGGTGAIAALALANFGNRVVMAGRFGSDLGDLLAPLTRAGVEVVALPARATQGDGFCATRS